MTDELNSSYDVVVVGGGAAGLNGALMLARSRRSVAVIDAGAPRNAPAEGVHGLLAREGTPPAELLARGREEVRGYGAHVVTGEVVAAERRPLHGHGHGHGHGGHGSTAEHPADEHEFVVTLADGRSVRARRLLVTTGLVDELPPIPGLRERWGKDVLHCPYCHGWEVRDQAIGVLASGPMSMHQALLFRQLSDDVTFFAHTRPLSDEEAEQLAARGIRVVTGEVAAAESTGGRLTGLRLADGTLVERDALAVATRMVARAGLLEGLGLRAVEHPSGAGEHVPADAFGRTEVPGLWVAGNVTDLMAQVGASAAAGAMAGAQINADLVAEETRAAVAASKQFSREYWEERHRSGYQPENVNAHLEKESADLTPGRALEAGCGEGTDARWLAGRGWRVSAVDISAAALDNARAKDAGGLVDWQRADLTEWKPEDEAYDLVYSAYVHPAGPRDDLIARLAAAVAPGGTLLIVGHHPSDEHSAAHASGPQVHFTAEEVAAGLDPARWEVLTAEPRTRTVRAHNGHGMTMRDTVLRARRR
ncbi:thioredoxin reductase [Nonomuraea soli]|uniref:Thioredoxin reductase n=1 Tax=Nonomuraea soli TaxID=1032476 RepID=A0A7W0CDM8_9ACTN|nr:bifunctional NAD(P)/FAD-dependent oxidoreductase/class I SAM-dependent methyltransferase [Nonomuraea soli]MBA2889204.1 thioredoxin reductase [Nonomuraea soli]